MQLLVNELFDNTALSLDKTNCSTWAAEYRITPLISSPFKQLAKAKQKQSSTPTRVGATISRGLGVYVRLGRRILIRPHCSAAELNNSWSHCVITQFAPRFLHCNEFFVLRRRDTTIKFAVVKNKSAFGIPTRIFLNWMVFVLTVAVGVRTLVLVKTVFRRC